jgi:hypothetical protein
LKLPPETIASRVEEMVESSAAEWDYRLKQQAHRIERLRSALSALTPPNHAAPPPNEPRR